MGQISLKVPDELLAQIDAKAKQLSLTRSAYVLGTVIEHLGEKLAPPPTKRIVSRSAVADPFQVKEDRIFTLDAKNELRRAETKRLQDEYRAKLGR